MSKRSRQSRLFRGQPGLLLVEEYPSIVLPDATELPRRPASDAQGYSDVIEVPEEDDDTDEDDVEATARIFISTPTGRPVGRSVSAVQAATPRMGRPRQLGTPRVVGGFSHPADLPSPAHVTPRPAVGFSEPDSGWQDSAWDDEDTGSWDNGEWDSRLDAGRIPMDDSDEDSDDSDEGFNHRPEPLRLALPQAAGEEASLVLAAGAVEDFDDDWDEEDDWSEELSEEDSEEDDSESIRLSLGSNSSLDFLRDLEERRSFKAPIWGPRPNSTGFDEDISFYEEDEEEDVVAFDDFEDTPTEADDLVRFEEESGRPGMAAVRVGAPIGFSAPRQLSPFSDNLADEPDESDEDEPEEIGFGMPRFPATDPLRAPPSRMNWTEDSAVDEEEETPRAWSDLSGMADDPVQAFLPGQREDPAQAKPTRPAAREPASKRRVTPPPKPTPPSGGIPPMVSAAAILLLIMSAAALIWVQFHEQLGLPFPTAAIQTAVPLTPEALNSEDPDVVVPDAPDPEGPIVTPEAPVEPVEEPVVEVPEVLTGKLMVTSDRPAAVFINNKKIGITPLEGPLDLDAGTYEVRATALRTGKKQRLQARVDAGKVLQVAFEFR